MKHVKAFDTLSDTDMTEYEVILNNPLCTILEKEHITKKEKFFSEEGVPVQSNEIPYILVHWEEKDI